MEVVGALLNLCVVLLRSPTMRRLLFEAVRADGGVSAMLLPTVLQLTTCPLASAAAGGAVETAAG